MNKQLQNKKPEENLVSKKKRIEDLSYVECLSVREMIADQGGHHESLKTIDKRLSEAWGY